MTRKNAALSDDERGQSRASYRPCLWTWAACGAAWRGGMTMEQHHRAQLCALFNAIVARHVVGGRIGSDALRALCTVSDAARRIQRRIQRK